jgi:hypothetical protein
MAKSEMRVYYYRVVSHGWGSVKAHMKSTVLAVLGAVVGVIILAMLQINPSSQTALRTLAGITWPLLLLVVYFVFYLVKAPWELHAQDAKIIADLKARPPVLNPPFYPNIQERGRRLESAIYGSAKMPPENVTAKLREFVSTGKRDIKVNHYELCKGAIDPDYGEDLKFLTVTYSETLQQSEMLRLPLDWLDNADRQKQEAAALEAETMRTAPHVSITYSIDEKQEILTFENTTPFDSSYFTVGPVSWTERHYIELPEILQTVRGHQTETRQMFFERAKNHGIRLLEFVRDRIPLGGEAPTVILSYSDADGVKHFERSFTLTIQRGKLVWQPSQVMLRPLGSQSA